MGQTFSRRDTSRLARPNPQLFAASQRRPWGRGTSPAPPTTLFVRSKIHYDTTSVSTKIVSRRGLGQTQTQIHRGVVPWVRRLEDRIRRALGMMAISRSHKTSQNALDSIRCVWSRARPPREGAIFAADPSAPGLRAERALGSRPSALVLALIFLEVEFSCIPVGGPVDVAVNGKGEIRSSDANAAKGPPDAGNGSDVLDLGEIAVR
jgi:hypothetical protein